MPTSRIRQAAVGMLGAHLANSCANFKKQHEASGNPASQFRSLTGRGRWLAAQQSRARVVPAPSFLATPNVAQAATALLSQWSWKGWPRRACWIRRADGRPNRHPEEDPAD
jgi:hypothetical protein